MQEHPGGNALDQNVPVPLVDADRIAIWGATEDAVDGLPELIARLISNSASIRRTVEGFRTGRGTRMGGYDGFTDVDSRSQEYLPTGPAVWELGTTDAPGSKAQRDYRDRTDDPGRVNKKTTAYVAVSSRRWDFDDWVADRNGEQEWLEVRAIDSSKLYHWVRQHPPVHAWLSERIGGMYTHGVVTPEEWWTEYSTRPPLRPEALTVGRNPECTELISRLESGRSDIIKVHATDAYEACAFVIATLIQLPEDRRDSLLFRTTIVEERDAWRGSFRAAIGQMILVPLFDDHHILPGALARDHIVVIPTTFDDPPDDDSIVLARPSRAQVLAAIEPVAPEDVAEGRLTNEVFSSISALRVDLDRRLQGDVPEWARLADARELVPVILAGEWDESREADRNTISELSERPYSDVINILVKWRLAPRAPVQKAGSVWMVNNRRLAWDWIHPICVELDLDRFRRVSAAVLTEPDPKFELPIDERWMAGGMGKVPSHSFRLRNGLASGLAMIASTNYEIDGHLSAEDWSCLAVRDVLESGDWLRWASIAPIASLLAEACPDEFLQAIERLFVSHPDAARMLFTDESDNFPSVDSPHVGILHALEVLGREPQYFSRVVVALATMVSIDPQGRLANRPLASLSALFLVGLPQTAATSTQRFNALDILRERDPEVAWKAMLAALPTAGRVVTPAPRPQWRHWPLPTDASDD